MSDEDFRAAAPRLFHDANYLSMAGRQATACHLYGLAAECALKHCLRALPGAADQLPRKHLPELREHVRLQLQGRRADSRGLRQLLSRTDYMAGWDIANRYWPDDAFDDEQSRLLQEHAQRTLIASGVAL